MSSRRRYHTLLSRDPKSPSGPQWSVEFGSFDRADVDAERGDYRDKGWKAGDLKIITTGPSQAEVTQEVQRLNA